MDTQIKKSLLEYSKEQHFFREYNNAIKHRDIPQFFAQLTPVEETSKTNRLLKKKEDPKQSTFFFDELKDPNLEYSGSPFYILYYSREEKNISLFKSIKFKLKEFGIDFIHKKKIDESFIIVMNEFFSSLASNNYQKNEYQKGLEVFQSLFDSQFSIKAINNESWIQFMKLFEEIIESLSNIFSLSYKDTAEFMLKLKTKILLEANALKLIEEEETLSNCSSSDPFAVAKEEIQRPTIDHDEELRKFQATIVESISDKNQIPKTVSKQFYELFGKKLKSLQQQNYSEAVHSSVKLLMDQSKTNDELLDPVSAIFNGDFETGLFLIQNRQEILGEMNKTMKDLEQSTKQRIKEKQYTNIVSNVIIKTKQKNKKNHIQDEKILDALRELGILGDENELADCAELRKQIQEKFGANDDDYYQEGYEIDFLEEKSDVLQKNFGMMRHEKDLTIVFDIVPAHKSLQYKETERLKTTNVFPEHLSPIFSDSETLNALQSVIFDTVYNTDENILCCAPTGAGKTNVALIAISRLLQRHVDPITRKVKSDFKVVYLSPLKALAAEIVSKFTKKLEYLGVVVRESTGDISLSKADISKTNIIVSTPEKWDVMTRKSEELNTIISLLIIDEIHLLDEVRGRVLECLVARTVRLIDAKQCRIRLLGLSATLPNYVDVARFLKVSKKGLFHFNESYRPVPLYKKFVGIKKIENLKKVTKETGEIIKSGMNRLDLMNQTCYELVKENLKHKKQILIFVHSRKETISFGQYLINQAIGNQELNLFCFDNFKGDKLARVFENRDLHDLVVRGIGAHNAGIKRKDRSNIEKAFIDGSLSIVICTATLAWGINMPCHTVIIKGTDFYEPGVGFRPISLLDVQQIFGRAGRPQFDKFGEAVLITKSEDLNYFISMLSHVKSIESHFKNFMPEAILAEIVLGNISNFNEAMNFIKSTFFYIRYLKNPTFYGVKQLADGPALLEDLIHTCLEDLHELHLIRNDPRINLIEPTELGRIASHYYINCETMSILCGYLKIYEDDKGQKKLESIETMDIIGIIAQATEFAQLSAKPEEEDELKKLKKEFSWIEINKDYTYLYQEKIKPSKEVENKTESNRVLFDQMDKVVLLFYGYLYGRRYETYSLESDTTYVTENGVRILRCLLEISLKENNALLAENILVLIRQIENCVNEEMHPIRMFCFENYSRSVSAKKNQISEMNRFSYLKEGVCLRLEDAMARTSKKNLGEWNVECIRENPEKLKGLSISAANEVMLKRAVFAYPVIDFEYEAKPIAQTIIKVTLRIKPCYEYVKNWNMKNENFWVFVIDENELIHHSLVSFDSTKANLMPLDQRSIRQNMHVDVHLFVPIRDKKASYDIKIMSDHFVDADSHAQLDLTSMQVGLEKLDFTNLLNLRPLRIGTLREKSFEKLFSENIPFFNPIQTQLFWPLYHTSENILIGAPTGSGKTIMAELAIFRLFRVDPSKKVVYIAPYKALVKERLKDWKERFGNQLGKKVHELSGDHTPNFRTLIESDVLLTTPEKWDGITRNWQSRSYVQSVGLVIFDEIHLLGQDRGSVLEVIVSRMNFIGAQTKQKIRMLGLSTAIANGYDVGSWFGVKKEFNFNFRPEVRPVQLEYHFRGFPEQNYCPRMNSMNKPAFGDIKKYASNAPALIFVSSRRQTRLTALDLIALSQQESSNSQFLKMSDQESLLIQGSIKDNVLKQTLNFGIGIHHAGLETSDRELVEHLFLNSKIMVLVATSTLAWGVNFPAKLVIIKGTEFFDAKTHSWVDMQVSDILQMAGRAGRPQFNEKGTVCVYLETSKKTFFRKYLNDPFPIESNLLPRLEEHFNAEISSGSIKNKQECVDFITWTYFFRRLVRNPTYYQLASTQPAVLQKYLINIVDEVLKKLVKHECVTIGEDDMEVNSTFIAGVASSYYISPKTVFKLNKVFKSPKSIPELINILACTEEYSEIPVRHGENDLNMQLSKQCPFQITEKDSSSPNSKAFLLFQAYLSDLQLPIRDYVTDTKLVIDSAFRIINAMIDISAENKIFSNCMNLIQIMQMFVQGCWINESPLINFPNFDEAVVKELGSKGVKYLCQLIEIENTNGLKALLSGLNSFEANETNIKQVSQALVKIPDVFLDLSLFKYDSENFVPIKDRPCRIKVGDEAFLELKCVKKNKGCSPQVLTKRWKKDKEYSWWVLVGNIQDDRLFALKKMNFHSKACKTLQFDIEKLNQFENQKVDVLFMSDSFIGIDQLKVFNLAEYWSPVIKS